MYMSTVRIHSLFHGVPISSVSTARMHSLSNGVAVSKLVRCKTQSCSILSIFTQFLQGLQTQVLH